MNILAYILVGLIWFLSLILAYGRGWSKGLNNGVDIWKPAYLELHKKYIDILDIFRKLNE